MPSCIQFRLKFCMGRKVRKSNAVRKTNRIVGKHTAYKVERRSPQGNYTIWRCQYVGRVHEPDANGLWQYFEKRLYAQGETAAEAEKQAKEKTELYLEYDEWFWARGALLPLTYKDWLKSKQALEVESNKLIAAEELDRASVTLAVAHSRYKQTRVRYNPDGSRRMLSDSYVRRVDNYVQHMSAISATPLSKLNFHTISSCFSQVQTGLAMGTCARLRAYLVTIGEYAVLSEYWSKNLFDRLPSLSFQPANREKRIYTLEEIDRMWFASRTDQQRALLVLLRLGLRFGEATALTSEDILDDETIQIRYSQSRKSIPLSDGIRLQPVLSAPKTTASMAKVYIPKRWMPILEKSLSQARPAYVQAWDEEEGDRKHLFVIPNSKGLLWQEATALAAMKRLLLRANVEFHTNGSSGRESIWHSFRYTYASELVAFGANDIELRYLMRHTDANLTKDVYARVRMEDKAQYEKYADVIKLPTDFNKAIASFDEDRRKAKIQKKKLIAGEK